MKKIIALLLAVVMVFALVACASTAKTEEKTDEPAPAETTNEQSHRSCRRDRRSG